MAVRIDDDAFRSLARSSPWRWSTLRFTHEERGYGLDASRRPAVRAWLRRPDRLRVEDRDTGAVLAVVHEGPSSGGAWLAHGGGSLPRTPRLPLEVEPELGPDGLVARRPRPLDTDAPMYRDYRWVAMLDPVELADGGGRDAPATDLTDVRATEHHGRPAWEAVVVPTASYDPRCSCCPLLGHVDTDLPPPPGVALADAHVVRLDVETGVCVHVLQIGGTHDGRTLDVAIEAVDEPMGDERFPDRPRRGLLGRSTRRT